MKIFFKPAMTFIFSLLLLTSCMDNSDRNAGTSTSDPAYNKDTRTPEGNDRKGDYEKTHKPNTGPDNDSDSMQ